MCAAISASAAPIKSMDRQPDLQYLCNFTQLTSADARQLCIIRFKWECEAAPTSGRCKPRANLLSQARNAALCLSMSLQSGLFWTTTHWWSASSGSHEPTTQVINCWHLSALGFMPFRFFLCHATKCGAMFSRGASLPSSRFTRYLHRNDAARLMFCMSCFPSCSAALGTRSSTTSPCVVPTSRPAPDGVAVAAAHGRAAWCPSAAGLASAVGGARDLPRRFLPLRLRRGLREGLLRLRGLRPRLWLP